MKQHPSPAPGSSYKGDGWAHRSIGTMLHSHSVPGVSSPTGLVPVKQQCARNRSQSCGLGACICSATAPASFSWWGCHSLPQPRCPKGSLPTHVLCQRLCHCSSATQLLIFTRNRSQPDLQLQDGRRKPVALPHALGCAEPPQLPHCPGRGQRVHWGWHGLFSAASWAGAVGRDAGEPVQQPRSPHGNTSTGAEIPPVSEAEAPHDACTAKSWQLFRALVPSGVLQRAEQKVAGGPSTPSPGEEKSGGSFLTWPQPSLLCPTPTAPPVLWRANTSQKLHKTTTLSWRWTPVSAWTAQLQHQGPAPHLLVFPQVLNTRAAAQHQHLIWGSRSEQETSPGASWLVSLQVPLLAWGLELASPASGPVGLLLVRWVAGPSLQAGRCHQHNF